jgi:hypothetical protein
MHAKHFEAFAAIGPIQRAGMAVPATDVGLDGAAGTRSYLFLIGWRANHFHAQLVAEDPWIGEKRLAAREGVQVGSTNADAMNADEGFSWTSFHRVGELFPKLPGLLKYDLAHKFDSISFAFLLT